MESTRRSVQQPFDESAIEVLRISSLDRPNVSFSRDFASIHVEVCGMDRLARKKEVEKM
jgi:hypothetical protein